MTVLYSKYKAENNALWTIMLNIVWKSTERFGKVWNFEMENV